MRRGLLPACGLLLSLLWPPFARAANQSALPAAVRQAIATALKTPNFEVRHFEVTGNRASFGSGTVLSGGRSCRVYLSRALPSPDTRGRYGPWRVDWYSCSKGQAGRGAAG